MPDFGASRIVKILGWIGGLFGIFGGGVSANVKRALESLRLQIVGVGQELVNSIRESGSFLARVVGLLRRFWSSGLLPLLRWLRTTIRDLLARLKRLAEPIFRLLARLRREWLEFYRRILRPILDTIEAIQFALRLLERVGVEWARRLDEILGEIRGWIEERFRQALGFINALEDRVYRVITADYLLERLSLLRSLERDAPFWIRTWWVRQIAPLSADDQRRFAQQPDPKTTAQHAAELEREVLFQDGPRAGLISELAADIRRELEALRGRAA